MENVNLEEMRSQFAILKEQLKKQEIINDRLIRETMKAKCRPMDTNKRMTYFCSTFAIIMFLTFPSQGVFRWPFVIFTCVMMLFGVVATHYIHKPVEQLDFMQQDFATVARVMAKFKRQYDLWKRYVSPAFIVPWLSWACYEWVVSSCPDDANPLMFCIPLIIGATIGALIGIKFHNKAANAAQEIIKDIEKI